VPIPKKLNVYGNQLNGKIKKRSGFGLPGNGAYFKWNFIKVVTNPEKGNKVKNIAWKELLV
jgi:hypothetical protein